MGLFGCSHDWTVIDMEVSHIDPPKAWYSVRCTKCEERRGGHASDLATYVDSIEAGDMGDATCASDVKQAYVRGDLDEIELERALEDVMGFRDN